ncbi:MAG: hypothetical protein Q8L78_02770 [Coxiellaceae bacterium]|nr:hypothetical protein [Coxiellaceae bacterium]
MVSYPSNEVNFSKMFRLSLQHHFKTFCYSLVCIILLFFSVTLSNKLTISNPYIYLVAKYLFIAVWLFFFSAALLATHFAFSAAGEGYGAAFKKTCARLPAIAGTIIMYLAGIIIILYATHYMRVGILHVDVNASQTIKGLLVILELVVLAVFVCMFFFSYPLCVINEKSLKKSFLDSAYLSEKNKMGIFLLLFIITLPYSLLIKKGLDFHFIAQYHLSFLYVFVVLSFFVPLFINLLLLLINDSKNQLTAEDE